MVPDRTERHRLPGPWPHPEAWRLSRAQSRLHQREGGIMARAHWENAIGHYDEAVHTFVNEYFGGTERRCLLVAAAGFDPRSRRIAEILASALGNRLQALFIREERGKPDASLVAAADENENQLKALVPGCQVVKIDVFGDDDAPVGGARIARSEEHTSELQSLMRISYAVFCLKKKKQSM